MEWFLTLAVSFLDRAGMDSFNSADVSSETS